MKRSDLLEINKLLRQLIYNIDWREGKKKTLVFKRYLVFCYWNIKLLKVARTSNTKTKKKKPIMIDCILENEYLKILQVCCLSLLFLYDIFIKILVLIMASVNFYQMQLGIFYENLKKGNHYCLYRWWHNKSKAQRIH